MKMPGGDELRFVPSLHQDLNKHFSIPPSKGVAEKIMEGLLLMATENNPLGKIVNDRAAVKKIYQDLRVRGNQRKGTMR